MELRKLAAKDLALMAKIITKIGFKEFRSCLDPEDVIARLGQGDNAVTAVGLSVCADIAGIILSNYPACEKEIQTFVSNLSGLTVEEVADLPVDEFAAAVVRIIQKPEFRDFFRVVSKLLS